MEHAPEDEPQEKETGAKFEEMEFNLTELMGEYVDGAEENIKAIVDGFLTLGTDPSGQEILFDIFRRVHGMKGSANMIGFTDIGEIAHQLENFLRAFHENKKPLTPNAVGVALGTMDTVAALLEGKQENPDFTMDIEPAIKIMKDFNFETEESQPASSVSTPSAPAHKPAKGIFESIRIRTNKVDELMMLAGELSSARIMINEQLGLLARMSARKSVPRGWLRDFHSRISSSVSLMDREVDEMRNAILSIRLLPLSNLFSRFPRLVRDISRRLGKKIDYSERGGETLLDRQIIEKMNEPLIHMIKNSVDHGIESPEEREKKGKTPQGTLRLSALSDRGKIIITLEDDGNGINGGMVKRKAIEKGIISEEEAAKLSEKQAQMLIFSPGFSTRDEATDISGRGVGMDAVKKGVEMLQGALDIESEPGKGTKFIITLPLTMASTPVLFVTVAGVTVAFPTAFMEKVTRISGDSIKTENGSYRLSLANENLPLCFLETVLTDESRFPADKEKIPIIIISTGSRRVAIAMDAITAPKEVVVKPLPSNIKNAVFWTGAALSPSGQIVPVLNIQSLISACAVH